jgi:hypothetical protein
MADANSTFPVPVAKNRHGQPLYNNPCAVCGALRLSTKSHLGNMCPRCASDAMKGGISRHPLYPLLKQVRNRCYCVSTTNYRWYGARGITVCDEWRTDAAAFIAWAQANGYAPGLELDRIDSNGPYAPWNCQFISHTANVRKSRKAKCDEQKAREVRAALANGDSINSIVAAFGLSRAVVSSIKHGKTWRDV